jgi:trehalose/maltose transport system substrate-binding protein
MKEEMKVKYTLLRIPVLLAVAAASSLAPPLATGIHAAVPRAATTIQAPPVPNGAAIRARLGGQSITFVSDNAVGSSHTRDLMLAAAFSRDTGIKVTLLPHPMGSDAAYTQLAHTFAARSPAVDVMMLDVIWPGAFAPYLVDLQPALGAEAALHSPSIIQNDTIGDRLVAMPWFGDFGILYYRTDLLKKYGYSQPPKTWTELGAMAARIQAGERKANAKFYGFVFQGNAYEGLTCNALEWLYSSGAGGFIDNGKVTIDNPIAVRTLNMIRGWVGTITPRGATKYQEADADRVFAAGNAAFERQWPYAYAQGQTSPAIKGKFDVTALPAVPGHAAVGTVGGWQVGISKYSKHIPAAVEWVRYLTSPAVERFDAIFNGNVPTMLSVAMDPAVRAANPYLKPEIAGVVRVARPAALLGIHYEQGSQAIYKGINEILNGRDARTVLPRIAAQLQSLLGT